MAKQGGLVFQPFFCFIRLKSFSRNFEKGIDKSKKGCYNINVNQKQQLKDEVDKMKQFFYETTFEATETLQNGNERRAKHKILSPMFRNNKPITEDEIMERGEEELHENGYYHIEYLGTKKVALMILD